MEEARSGVREVVLQELARLGMQECTHKKGQNSNKFRAIGLRNSSSSASSSFSKASKLKSKGKSPRAVASKSPVKPFPREDHRKLVPKSPFSSAKRRAEARRLNHGNRANSSTKGSKNKVFGQELGQVAQVCVYLSAGGDQVKVPQLMVDLCNHVRRSITTEGIFRKAGSANRQSDLKRLLDGGTSLPSSVHVIDCACLLKQYLRCLPEPLLSPEVHSRVVACMELGVEERVEAVALCVLLLPHTHTHALLYLMDFFSEVVVASSSNKMDARNLAIVLAPNILPPTLSHPPASLRKSLPLSSSTPPTEDAMLATNIEILQLLIENSATLCRMPSYVVETLEHRLTSQSTEDLVSATSPHHNRQPSGNGPPHQHIPIVSKKKRRSASIHRLVTGFRRVVGHNRPDPVSPSPTTHLTNLDLYPGVALSPVSSVNNNSSPRKRKSADAHDLRAEELSCREEAGPQETPPSCKRAKLEDGPTTGAATPAKLPLHRGVPSETRSVGVGESQLSSCLPLVHPTPKAATAATNRRTPSEVPRISVHHTVGSSSSNNRRGRRSVDSLYMPNALTPSHQMCKTQCHMAGSSSPLAVPSAPYMKRRSCDLPLMTGGAKRSLTSETGGQATRRRSSIKTLNEPDGAASWSPGPRGVPDGAECTLRNQPSTPLQALEQHYDDIKSVVLREEQKLDQSAMNHMRAALFSDTSATTQNLSFSDMIQSAYERMRVETEGQLGTRGPSDTLTRRLDRELKIRSRRSGEHRVIRSPSERRIGTIRRRSRESVQNTAKSLITSEEAATPAPAPSHLTPKMKATLLHTPVTTSLRRGRPNSVKSGLPLVVRSSTHSTDVREQEETTPASHSSRLVVVSRRGEEEGTSSDNSVKKLNIKHTSEDTSTALGESASHHLHYPLVCTDRLPTTPVESDLSGVENSLMGSFLEQVMGPMTRRQSSLLSFASSIPQLKLSPSSSPLSNELGPEEMWVRAPDFLKEDEGGEDRDGVVGRPSLAALVQQKKVAAAVQLFNNLHPSSSIEQQRGRSRRPTRSATMTPRELLKARAPPPKSPARVAVVTPLRESTLVNIQQDHHMLKIPQEYPSLPLSKDFNSAPKLPPRGTVRPSPIRMQYR